MEPKKSEGVTTTKPSSHLFIRNVKPTYNAQGIPVLEPLTGSFPPPRSEPARREAVIGLPHQEYRRGESMSIKRGRPIMCGPQGCMAFSSQFQHSAATSSPGGSSSRLAQVKKRGRPLGATKKHKMEAPLGPGSRGFIPHVVTVQAGEEVSSKLMSSSRIVPRAICILSGSGAISTVTLRHPASSGGTTTYEGLFNILSISGSFSLSEGGQQSKTGGLSISLACQDGRFLGGCVAGPLIAASAVQVVVGNFTEEEHRDHHANNQIPLSAQKFIPDGDSTGPSSSPPSYGTHSESSGMAGRATY